MRKRRKLKRALSGILVGVAFAASILSPFATIYSAETEKPPSYEEVKEQLNEDETVIVNNLELEQDSALDAETAFTELEIKDESNVMEVQSEEKVSENEMQTESVVEENKETEESATMDMEIPVTESEEVYETDMNMETVIETETETDNQVIIEEVESETSVDSETDVTEAVTEEIIEDVTEDLTEDISAETEIENNTEIETEIVIETETEILEESEIVESIPETEPLPETEPEEPATETESPTFEDENTTEDQNQEIYDDVTKLLISKTDVTESQEIPGAKLTILDTDDQVIASWVSGTEPHYIEKLPIGQYTLREEKASEGYVMVNDVMFEIADTAEIQKVTMKNATAKGKILINKIDAESGKPLKGVEFELRDASGKVLETMVTDDAGHAESKLYEIAEYDGGVYATELTYILVESNVLPGYVNDKTEYQVTFKYEGEYTPVIEIVFELTNEETSYQE